MNSQEIKEVVLHINDVDVAKKLASLQKQLEGAEKAKARLEEKKILSPKEVKDLQDYSKIINASKASMNRMRASAEQVEHTLSNLGKATVPELKKTLKALEKEMNSGNIDRGSELWHRYEKALREVRTELREIQTEQKAVNKSLGTSLKQMGKSLVGITTVTMQVMQALTGIRQTILGAVNAYAEMEEHMSQVRKYTGMTTEEVHALNEEFKRMDTRTSREQLNDLAGDAGRLGIQGKQDVLDFVQAADQINVALGEDLGEDGVKNIGKLAQLFGDSDRMGLKKAMLSTGSVINELAQSSSAAEGYILNFTSRLAGVGHQANMSQAHVMAFASVLDQGMVRCERGATALQNVITALYRQPQKMAQVAGLDVKKFTETLQKDGNAALLQFIEALHRAGKMDVLAPMLKEMKLSGSGVTQTISTLANNLDKLKATQEQATQAFKEGTSVTNEFNVQNNTVQGQMEKAKKRFHDVAVELGQKLQPAVKYLISGTSVGIKALSGLVTFIGNNIWRITALAVAVGVLTAAWKAQRIEIMAHTAATKIDNAISAIAKFLTQSLTVAKLTLAKSYAYLTGNMVKARAAQIALNSAMGANPIAKVITLLLALGTAIWALFSKTKELTKAEQMASKVQRDIIEASAEANKSIGDQVGKVRLLTAIVNDNNRTMKERKGAIEALKKIVPGYNAEIGKEGKIVRENTKAIDKYIDALKRQAMVKAMQGRIEEMAGDILNAEMGKRGWMGGLGRIKNELSVFERENAAYIKAQKEINNSGAVRTGYAGDAYAKILKDNGLTQKEFDKAAEKFKDLLERQSKVRGKIREYQDMIDILNGRSDTLTKVFTTMGGKMEDLMSTIGGPGGISGGDVDDEEYTGYSEGDDREGNSKEEQERRKKAREADVRIEQEAKEKLRQMDAEFVASGRTDYLKYLEERNAAEVKYLEQRQACWNKGDNEWVSYHEKVLEKQSGLQKEQNAWSLKDLDRQYAEKLALAKKDQILSADTEEQKQAKIDSIELEHLQKRAEWLRQNGGTPQEVIDAGIKADELAKQQELRKEQRHQERLKVLKEEYLKQSAEDIYNQELALLEELMQKELVGQEQYQAILLALKRKLLGEEVKAEKDAAQAARQAARNALDKAGYNDEKWSQGKNYGASGIAGALVDVGQSLNQINRVKETYKKLQQLRQEDKISAEDYAAAKKELDQQSFDNFVAMAQAAYATVGAMMTSYTELMSVSRDQEVAKTEASYDRQIQAAGNNTAKGKKLEEQKQAAVAKIKNRYNKRMMAVEVAQAMAQTAMNALMAYGSVVKIPVVGPTLAAAAAAAATVAGMIQVAAIKKQHQAESTGYWTGGYTGSGDWREPAGVVHKDEWVANHRALANPNVAPVIRFLDSAQRHNTIGSLTAEDVSTALPMSAASSAASPIAAQQPMVIQESERTGKALERLNDHLDRGIPSYVTIDGPQGFARQWKHYQKLMDNK